MSRMACKPGSVLREAQGWPFIWDRRCRRPRAVYPEGRTEAVLRPVAARPPYLTLLPVGLAVPALLPEPRWALTPPFHLFQSNCSGSLISVALSLGLPPPGVTRHRRFVEPGLSSPSGATIRPSATSGARRPGPRSRQGRGQDIDGRPTSLPEFSRCVIRQPPTGQDRKLATERQKPQCERPARHRQKMPLVHPWPVIHPVAKPVRG